MKGKMVDLFYGLLLLLGIMAGIYGIGLDLVILKWTGAIIVFGVPSAIALVQYFLRN